MKSCEGDLIIQESVFFIMNNKGQHKLRTKCKLENKIISEYLLNKVFKSRDVRLVVSSVIVLHINLVNLVKAAFMSY